MAKKDTKKPQEPVEEEAPPAAEGAEGEGVTPLDDESDGKKLNLKKILLILIPVVLIAAGAGLYFTGMLDKLLGKTEQTQEQAQAKAEEAPPETAAFIELPDLLVNLSSTPGAQQRYLKLKIKLEVTKEEDKAKVEAIAPRVVDQFQTFLREMRLEDLRGSAGMYRLRQELLYRVNLAARPVQVRDVLFQEILVQ